MKKPASSLADYSLSAKIFHWINATAFLVQFPLGFLMVQLDHGKTADLFALLHKSLGFLILWLVLLRLANRLRTGMRRRDSNLAGWHARASTLAHWTIYALLFLVPVTGWAGAAAMNSLELLGGFSLPAILAPNDAKALWLLWGHGLLAFGLLAIVAVHIGFGLQGYLEGETRAEGSTAPATPAA